MRRTYKILRSLKGKKLIFARKTPKVYGLTCNGEKFALVLQDLAKTVEETWNSSEIVMKETPIVLKVNGLSNSVFR